MTSTMLWRCDVCQQERKGSTYPTDWKRVQVFLKPDAQTYEGVLDLCRDCATRAFARRPQIEAAP